MSPDGIHWKAIPEPLCDRVGNGDGGPDVHRDEQTGKYIEYMRANYPRRRSISRVSKRAASACPSAFMPQTRTKISAGL